MASVTDLTQSHVFVDGQLVSAKVQRVVQAIKEYEPELEVKWIPPSAREPGQAAFAIIHDAPGNAPYVLFYVKDEEEFDERVLYRIIVNDQRNGAAPTHSELEAWEETQRRIKHQEFLDQMEEAHDIAKFALRTKLNKFSFHDPRNGKLITIRE